VVHARSALFDVYGDHLRARGGTAPVAALVRLMSPLGIAAPAVRTAVSRMVRQGWLEPVTLPAGRGYRATPRCVQRLDEAHERVYRIAAPAWDGSWHVVVLARVANRGSRDRLRAGLSFLGYASLGDSTWVAARPSAGVDELLAIEDVRAERFTSTYDGDAAGMVSRAWDLDALARSYERWLKQARTIVERAHEGLPGPGSDVAAFATRSRLVHEWRKFLFSDPGLPAGLLPDDWPGERAAAFFTAEAERLRPAALRHVDACLTSPSPARPTDRPTSDRPTSDRPTSDRPTSDRPTAPVSQG
jgi:phenylacetic acid degradation operon negative regulatory protein